MSDYNKRPYIASIIILIIILLCFVGFSLYRNYTNSKAVPNSYINYEMHDKVYGVNEYSNVVITEQRMAEIYLTNYLYILRTDLNKAYKLIDKQYIKDNNFDYNKFVEYVKTLNISNTKVLRYNVYLDDNKKYYSIISTSESKFIFQVDGVMTYTVKFS